MALPEIGVLGATSPVGAEIVRRLAQSARVVLALSRQAREQDEPGVVWLQLGTDAGGEVIPLWICAAPLWVLPEHFSLLERCGVRRLVALSSTSLFAKLDSADPAEQALAQRLTQAEAALQAWADARGVEWVLLRPTLIYGSGRDRNISEIVRFVRRYHFFPLVGAASGLRQPVHVEDVAQACCAALDSPVAAGRAYNLSGGERLSYAAMARRSVSSAGLQPRMLRLPLWVFCFALGCVRRLPRCKDWSFGMAERMNRDQVFDHADAVRDLSFAPRSFQPEIVFSNSFGKKNHER